MMLLTVSDYVYLYSDLPPMVARLEKTLRSVMFSGQDWMLRKPDREKATNGKEQTH